MHDPLFEAVADLGFYSAGEGGTKIIFYERKKVEKQKRTKKIKIRSKSPFM